MMLELSALTKQLQSSKNGRYFVYAKAQIKFCAFTKIAKLLKDAWQKQRPVKY